MKFKRSVGDAPSFIMGRGRKWMDGTSREPVMKLLGFVLQTAPWKPVNTLPTGLFELRLNLLQRSNTGELLAIFFFFSDESVFSGRKQKHHGALQGFWLPCLCYAAAASGTGKIKGIPTFILILFSHLFPTPFLLQSSNYLPLSLIVPRKLDGLL